MRLEFFGEELESLRYFDPFTQISRESIENITLPPAGELGTEVVDQRKSHALRRPIGSASFAFIGFDAGSLSYAFSSNGICAAKLG